MRTRSSRGVKAKKKKMQMHILPFQQRESEPLHAAHLCPTQAVKVDAADKFLLETAGVPKNVSLNCLARAIMPCAELSLERTQGDGAQSSRI